MNGSHIAGGGVGGLVGVIVAALDTRIGLHLSPADAGTLVLGTLAAGAAVFHVLGRAGSTVGVFPALRRFLFGPPKPVSPVALVAQALGPPEPPPAPPAA